MSTDALVAHYKASTDLPDRELDAAIGVAIDAVYTARDTGKNMHDAGAAAAVAALTAAREVRRADRPARRGMRRLPLDEHEWQFLRELLADPFAYAVSRLDTPEAEHTHEMRSAEEIRDILTNRIEDLR